mmetsp:Transcript_22212/g.29014  ORF Transcript_22212/g.29014 Transcript_22212/m.29014 type:complete len:200 (+) Transcript_22212:363-962(+)
MEKLKKLTSMLLTSTRSVPSRQQTKETNRYNIVCSFFIVFKVLLLLSLFQYKDVYPPNQQNSMVDMLTQPMGAMASPYKGTVSKSHCLVIKRAAQTMNMVGGIMDTVNNTSALGMAFGGGAQKMMKAQEDNASRTYYFSFETAADRDQWIAAIQNNMSSYETTPEYREAKQSEFKAAVRQVGGNAEIDLTPYLDALHSP